MEFLIPIAFFACIAYTIKVVVEARTRAKFVSANVPQELLKSILVVEEQQRRHSALRWGIVLICMAIGFGLIEAFRWEDVGPGAVALLIGSTGIGNVAFYLFARHLDKQVAVHA